MLQASNADEILIRASSASHMMVDPKTNAAKAAGELAEGVKTHLIDLFVSAKYNRFTDINSKFFEKGNIVEDDSITTISRITKTFLKKNEEWIKNEYVSGTPDLFIGKSIMEAEIIRDAKSSWDIYTFNRSKNNPLKKEYYWQLQCYMALTGARSGYIDYCLNNTPYHLVEGELRKESYKHADGNTPAWMELQIIANHVYDVPTFNEYIRLRGIAATDDNSKAVVQGFVEVPLEERHFSFHIARNDEDINILYDRIVRARKWMNENLFLINF